jgi:hypothetical protein
MPANDDPASEESFAELMGKFSADRVKRIVAEAEFHKCEIKGMRDFMELVVAGICILVHRHAGPPPPRTWKEVAMGMVDKSPLAVAVVFLAVVLLKLNGGPDILSLFSAGGPP